MAVDHAHRAHALLSASSAHRWIMCPPSAAAAELYPRQDTAYTIEGTHAHEVAEIVAHGVKVQETLTALPFEPDDEMLKCAEDYRDYIDSLKAGGDIILLERRVDFSDWVPDGFGAADCVMISGPVMHVVDYKYGKGVEVSAKENPQTMLYGLGALAEYGIALDVEKVSLHIFQPRIGNVSVWDISAADLLNFADEVIRPAAEKAAAAEGDMMAGRWCQFCPHAGHCPELSRHCLAAVDAGPSKAVIHTLAPFQLAQLLDEAPIIETWLKALREAAFADLLEGKEVPGYKLVSGRASRSWTDEAMVATTLKAAGYTQEDITKTELLSVAAMEKALGKKRAKELLSTLVETKTGAPTLAPASDKRQAYDPLAQAKEDFA